jgi:ATPase subunit of ABC transporter with duplicated ATPase domains
MALASNDETTVDMLIVLQRHAEELRRGTEVKSISPKAQEQLLELLSLSESACEAAAQQHIRKSLAFPDMRGRFEAVETAHYDTFRWIFEASPEQQSNDTSLITDPEDNNQGFDDRPDNNQVIREAGDLFITWLESGSGIFHISGKLGSGKSTLMKFLCEHPDTKEKLIEWAGTYTAHQSS